MNRSTSGAEERPIRVLVVDDHVVVREGLRLILQVSGKDMELVGEAADGATAFRLVEETQPQVVLSSFALNLASFAWELARIASDLGAVVSYDVSRDSCWYAQPYQQTA